MRGLVRDDETICREQARIDMARHSQLGGLSIA